MKKTIVLPLLAIGLLAGSMTVLAENVPPQTAPAPGPQVPGQPGQPGFMGPRAMPPCGPGQRAMGFGPGPKPAPCAPAPMSAPCGCQPVPCASGMPGPYGPGPRAGFGPCSGPDFNSPCGPDYRGHYAGFGHRDKHFHGPDPRFHRNMPPMAGDRNLTPEQQQKLDEIRLSHQKKSEALHDKLFVARHVLNSLENSTNPDVQAVSQAAQEVVKLRGELREVGRSLEQELEKAGF